MAGILSGKFAARFVRAVLQARRNFPLTLSVIRRTSLFPSEGKRGRGEEALSDGAAENRALTNFASEFLRRDTKG
jgi:hypothetical protein